RALAPLHAAIESLRRQPRTHYSLRHFEEVLVRYIDKKDGTVDLEAARAVLCDAVPSTALPAAFLEATRVTLKKLGIRARQPAAFDDDHSPT
ncbi:MAG: hypothetical protein ACK5XG_14550, partial [Burkholderiales bacterium]